MSHSGRNRLNIAVDELAEFGYELRTMTVESHYIGCLGGEPVENHDLTASGFIEHRCLNSVSERGEGVCQDDIDVFNIAPAADCVVGNVILHIFYAALVSYYDVVQSGVIETGVFFHTSGKFNFLGESTKADFSGKTNGADIFGRESFRHLDFAPISSTAGLSLQHCDFIISQVSVHSMFADYLLLLILVRPLHTFQCC